MKKIFIFFVLFLFVFAFTHEVRADYPTDYQTYITSTGTYQTAYNDYVVARSAYLASGSLDSEDKAKAATLKMLQARDMMVINYLNAIKTKVQVTPGLTDGDKSPLNGELSTETSWYSSHMTKLSSAGSLQDLVADNDEAKGQWSNSTLIIIYQNLIVMGAGDNNYFRGKINDQISALQNKIAEIKANQDKDVSLIERTLTDAQNKLSRSQDKDNAAKDAINSIKPNSFNSTGNGLQDAQSDLLDSNAYLKEANQELLQIITQIKTN